MTTNAPARPTKREKEKSNIRTVASSYLHAGPLSSSNTELFCIGRTQRERTGATTDREDSIHHYYHPLATLAPNTRLHHHRRGV
jgi:hypothetical protein